jgi:N6-L-threonylcarbamoyladenine synthase
MIILGIETSCDDTSVAIVKNGTEVLSNIVWSQNDTHKLYGGIVPELGARRHVQVINLVLKKALEEANIEFSEIDCIAVNNQKGLVRSLVVGVSASKALSLSLNKPLVPVHHIEGHIFSSFIENPDLKFPHLCLTVSGGHNLLVLVNNFSEYEVIGKSLDDAAGEVFDKVARYLNLGFPGGPVIDKLSKIGNPQAFHFSRPMISAPNFDFSFSGLKTHIVRKIDEINEKNISYKIEDLVASIQEAIIETLVIKTLRASEKYSIDQISVVGGVSANSRLKGMMVERKNPKTQVFFPSLKLSTDNAAMIATIAYYKFQQGIVGDLDLEVFSNHPL